MEETTVFHIVRITPEVRVDYSVINVDKLPSYALQDIKTEVEDYITHNRKIQNKHYFKIKYLDEFLNKELYAFIKKRIRLLNMQNWELVGVCECQDWSEELEESGRIRTWIDTKIENLPKKEKDWVVEMLVDKIIDKMEEIYDIGGREFYIEAREIIARELSRQYSTCDGNQEVEPKRIRYYLRKRGVNSTTADAILGELDNLLEQARSRDDF